MSNLFTKVVSLATQKEDTFTECLAAALREDADLRMGFIRTLCASKENSIQTDCADARVETQVSFPGSCVDMLLHLDDRRVIGVEHKLWSPEGDGQLKKYLCLPLDGIAFITAFPARIASSVVSDPKYLFPAHGKTHFMWSDFFEVVSAAGSRPNAPVLSRALLNIFLKYGFEPPRPELGDLQDSDEERARENRRNFAKLWKLTRAGLEKRGYAIGTGSFAELYVTPKRRSRIREAWLDPIWQRGSLRVRLYFKNGTDLDRVEEHLCTARLPLGDQLVVRQFHTRRKKNTEYGLDVSVPFRILFEAVTDCERMTERLAGFVLPLLDYMTEK